MSYNSNLKTWSDSGSEYPEDYSYEAGEQPIDEYDNYVIYNIIEDIHHLLDEKFSDSDVLNAISDSDIYPNNVSTTLIDINQQLAIPIYDNTQDVPDETLFFNKDEDELKYKDLNGDIHGTIEDSFSGSYNDLTDVPSEFTPQTHGNEAHEEDYITEADVDGGAPSPHGNAHHDPEFAEVGDLFSGSYNDLSNVPTEFSPVSHGNEAHEQEFVDESGASDAAPVQSINGEIGIVSLEASDVGAESDGSIEQHRQNDIHETPQPPQNHNHNGDTLEPDEISGHISNRGSNNDEPITHLSGNIYVTQEGEDDPTEHEGDIWFEVVDE